MMTKESGVAQAASRASPAAGSRRVVSALAYGAALAAAACAVAAALAGLGHRWGWWDYRAGLLVLTLAAGGAVLALVVGAVAGVLGRRRRPALIVAMTGIVIAALTAAPVAQQLLLARKLPPIHDISTDTDDPPHFVAVLPLRASAPNPPQYGGPDIARRQKLAYPYVAPLLLTLPPAAAFDRALDTARAQGWEIVAAVPAEGRIEATATTFWFGFKDDVVIRVRAADGGSRIDVRSVSRVGRSDVGANAKRIRRYLAALGRSAG